MYVHICGKLYLNTFGNMGGGGTRKRKKFDDMLGPMEKKSEERKLIERK